MRVTQLLRIIVEKSLSRYETLSRNEQADTLCPLTG